MQRAYRKLWLVNLVCYRVHETDGGVGKKGKMEHNHGHTTNELPNFG